MKFPQTAEDVEREIIECKSRPGDLRVRQFLKILPKVENELIIEGIIRTFENNEDYDTQEIAGRILQELNLKSNKSLDEVLERTLKNWDLSIEQLPYWLIYNYGMEKVHNTIQNFENEDKYKSKLKTIKYWIRTI